MSNNQQLLDRLYALSMDGAQACAEFVPLAALIYRRLEMTYADDEAFEAHIAGEPVELAAFAAAA